MSLPISLSLPTNLMLLVDLFHKGKAESFVSEMLHVRLDFFPSCFCSLLNYCFASIHQPKLSKDRFLPFRLLCNLTCLVFLPLMYHFLLSNKN